MKNLVNEVELLKLPQCEINFTPAISDSEILLAAGGRRPNEKFFKAVAQGRIIFAVDKGI